MVERRRRRQFLGVFSPSCRDQAWFKKKKDKEVNVPKWNNGLS